MLKCFRIKCSWLYQEETVCSPGLPWRSWLCMCHIHFQPRTWIYILIQCYIYNFITCFLARIAVISIRFILSPSQQLNIRCSLCSRHCTDNFYTSFHYFTESSQYTHKASTGVNRDEGAHTRVYSQEITEWDLFSDFRVCATDHYPHQMSCTQTQQCGEKKKQNSWAAALSLLFFLASLCYQTSMLMSFLVCVLISHL